MPESPLDFWQNLPLNEMVAWACIIIGLFVIFVHLKKRAELIKNRGNESWNGGNNMPAHQNESILLAVEAPIYPWISCLKDELRSEGGTMQFRNVVFSVILVIGGLSHPTASLAETGWVCSSDSPQGLTVQKYRIAGKRLLTTGDAFSAAFGPITYQILQNTPEGLVAVQSNSAQRENNPDISISAIMIDKTTGDMVDILVSVQDPQQQITRGKCADY
jgi:hypothetical protein